MRKCCALVALFCINASGILPVLKGADATQRYYRVVCLVHLTGSGAAGDPIVPEYVGAGVAVAQAGAAAAIGRATSTTTATTNGPAQNPAPGPAPGAGQTSTGQRPAPTPAYTVARPGIIAWRMTRTDDGTMAIVHMVAVDHHAFDAVLADTRPEISVFEVGKTPTASIEAAMQSHKQGFSLANFQVVAQ